QPLLDEERRAAGVVLRGIRIAVLAAVQLDDQARRMTVEVRDVRADRVLSAKDVPAEPLLAQIRPHATLGVSAPASQLPRESDEATVGHARSSPLDRRSACWRGCPHPSPPPEYRERGSERPTPSFPLSIAWLL